MVFGAFSEISEEARKLLCYAADLALLKNRLYRRWGIKTPREYARIKIYVLRLFFGKPDFTNALGHGDDDARFYDRAASLRTRSRGIAPPTTL